MLEESFKKTEEDSDAKIVSINGDEVLIDVGKKSEGILNVSEITDANGNLTHKVGDTIKVVITGSRNGRPIVSHKKHLEKRKLKLSSKLTILKILAKIDVKVVGKK